MTDFSIRKLLLWYRESIIFYWKVNKNPDQMPPFHLSSNLLPIASATKRSSFSLP